MAAVERLAGPGRSRIAATEHAAAHAGRRCQGAEQGKRLPSGDRADLDHLRDIVVEQVLDAVLQRDRRARAAGAGAAHVEVDHAALEAVEDDVAAVLRHRRADPRLDQLLDLATVSDRRRAPASPSPARPRSATLGRRRGSAP